MVRQAHEGRSRHSIPCLLSTNKVNGIVGKTTKEAEKDTAKVSRHHAATFRFDKPWEYDTTHVNLLGVRPLC